MNQATQAFFVPEDKNKLWEFLKQLYVQDDGEDDNKRRIWVQGESTEGGDLLWLIAPSYELCQWATNIGVQCGLEATEA